jgi:TolB-like protein
VFTLKLLGGASLEGGDGPLTGRVAQRRRLAVLAMLAMTRRPGISREKLAATLWPESDVDRARHLLSDTVSVINRALGGDVVTAVADELRLRVDRLACDARTFEDAAERGALDIAVRLYTGPFLEGFFVEGSEDFERWASAERERLQGLYRRALARLASVHAVRGLRADRVSGEALDNGARAVPAAPQDLEPIPTQAIATIAPPRAHGFGRLPQLGVGILIAAVVLFSGIRFVWPRSSAAVTTTRLQSVAVLPFADLSPAGDQEYFGDGIAEELSTRLGRAPELKVAARTSAFAFKGTDTDVKAIGRALNVDAVLEGSVRQAEGRVGIAVRLVDARAGFQIWADSWERSGRDVLGVQDEIATGVLRARSAPA